VKKKERKKIEKWRREWDRERSRREAIYLAHTERRRAGLAISDDGGIEKAIRKVWNWANDQLQEQDAQDVVGALQALQGKQSEALDIFANLTGAALDPFPAPALTSRTGSSPAARASRSDEVARELMRDPEVRCGFLQAQQRMKDGTWGLTPEQIQAAAKMGITDRPTLAAMSVAMSAKPSTPAGGSSPLTPELQKFCRRLAIADPDPKAVREMAAKMRSGAGVEMQLKHATA